MSPHLASPYSQPLRPRHLSLSRYIRTPRLVFSTGRNCCLFEAGTDHVDSDGFCSAFGAGGGLGCGSEGVLRNCCCWRESGLDLSCRLLVEFQVMAVGLLWRLEEV